MPSDKKIFYFLKCSILIYGGKATPLAAMYLDVADRFLVLALVAIYFLEQNHLSYFRTALYNKRSSLKLFKIKLLACKKISFKDFHFNFEL